MKRYKIIFCIALLLLTVLVSCSEEQKQNNVQASVPLDTKQQAIHPETSMAAPEQSLGQPGEIKNTGSENTYNENSIIEKYKDQAPGQWSETAYGVKTKLDTNDKVLALTFDTCGGEGGSGYDKELVDYLIRENVPATLFINSRWIDKNYDAFIALSQNSLFEIENHGTEHKPLSVNGKSAYGIPGTKNIKEVIDEIKFNDNKIYKITGRRTRFFRSGTAYYDEVAVNILIDLGKEPVGYNVLGDAGATYSKEQVKKALCGAMPGSIILCHMNHPEKETAEGIMEAVPALKAAGYRFAKLEDYPLK